MPYPDDFSWSKFDAAMGDDLDWLEEDCEIWNALQEVSKKLDTILTLIPTEASYRFLRDAIDTMKADLSEDITNFEDDSTVRAREAAENYDDYDPSERWDE